MTEITQTPATRPDGRAIDELREIKFETGIAPHALGSVLVSFGATSSHLRSVHREARPRLDACPECRGRLDDRRVFHAPYSTLDRKARDISRGKADGRTIEIQRLIGRSMRAVFDLKKLPGKTIWIDCDVLQADGGTRTASITGAYVAAQIAIQKLIAEGQLEANPFNDSVAAVSVGIYKENPVLDLNYLEDKDASVDANLVMTGTGKCVEARAPAKKRPSRVKNSTRSPASAQKASLRSQSYKKLPSQKGSSKGR